MLFQCAGKIRTGTALTRGEPRPSATDLREARYPMALHVLAGRPFPRATDGNAEWSLRAWRIADLDLAEVPITVP